MKETILAGLNSMKSGWTWIAFLKGLIIGTLVGWLVI